jgi:DNA polymerase-1
MTKDFVGDLLKEKPKFGRTEKPYHSLWSDTGKNTVLLIDGDIPAYRASAPCDGTHYVVYKVGPDFKKEIVHKERYKKKAIVWAENHLESWHISKETNPEPEGYAIYNTDAIMRTILSRFDEEKPCIKVYLTGNTNFRNRIYKEYKKNREDMATPVHLNACKQHLINRYNAYIVEGYEADDLIGMEARKLLTEEREFIICTLDKDLNCIPGHHYDWTKDTITYFNEEDSLRFFFTQCLVGDKTDNIPGIKGIGPVKAAKILKDCKTESQFVEAVQKEWIKFIGDKDKGINAFIITAELLWILQGDKRLIPIILKI